MMRKMFDILKCIFSRQARISLAKFIVFVVCFIVVGLFCSNVRADNMPYCTIGQQASEKCICGTKELYESDDQLDVDDTDICARLEYCKSYVKKGNIDESTRYVCEQLTGKAKEDALIKLYSQYEEVVIDENVLKLTKDADIKLDNDVNTITGPLEKLREFTTIEGSNNHGEVDGLWDAKATDMLQRIDRRLIDATQEGKITASEREIIWEEAKRLYTIGAERASEAAILEGNEDRANRIRDAIKFTKAEVFPGKCPSSDLIRAKYTSGCWSCLVVEKLTSSFLKAASKAYGLCQKAGKILLTLGAILWLAFWGLRNVSSLTQLEPGNILNELVKFAFKVALAYAFISGGRRFVGTYFINPIMGVGAKIAESFWAEDIDEYLDEYKWDTMTEEDLAQQNKEVQEILSTTPMPTEEQENVISTPLSSEDKTQLSKNDENFAQTETGIPNLLIPGIQTGCLSCHFGCRVSPCVGCSTAHKGIDIGLACVNKKEWAIQGNNCVPVIAAGPGIISYKGPDGNGAGYRATIDHGKVGKYNWATRYFHMRTNSGKFRNGDKVSQGQPIGCVGNTGVGTATHLHFEVLANSNQVDPLLLPLGKVQFYDWNTCSGKEDKYTEPTIYKKGMQIQSGWPAAGTAVVSVVKGVTANGYGYEYGSAGSDVVVSINNIKYTGPTDILSEAVMNSILGATAAIGNITAENMVLGDVVMCYAGLENGGAWNLFGMGHITNPIMWFEGMFFFCTGMLLSLAVVFYLIDISFKIGFAVIALPIAVGLWPFKITEDKLGICISIIAKSAAIYAFMAIAVTYTVHLTDAVFSYEDSDTETQAEASADSNTPKGLAKLYSVYDDTLEMRKDIDTEYATRKLALFSTTFILILFAFLYSYKLIQETVNETSNKFFSDAAFGSQSPMHSVGRAFAGKIKDIAAAPAKWAGDVAFYQGGRFVDKGVSGLVGGIKDRAKGVFGKGSGNRKTLRGRGARGVGNVTKAAGALSKGLGKAASLVGMKKAGAKLQNAGNKINDFGKDIKSYGDAVDKKANDWATRNKSKNDQGEK